MYFWYYLLTTYKITKYELTKSSRGADIFFPMEPYRSDCVEILKFSAAASGVAVLYLAAGCAAEVI